jgi:hypothetical protein
VHIYVWYALIFTHAVADAAGSSVSGFSSRLVLFVFVHYYVMSETVYVISLYISSLLFSCHIVSICVCLYIFFP